MKKIKRLVIGILVVVLSCGTLLFTACGDCAHSFGEWTVTKQSTCEGKGERQRTCSSCGHTESENTPERGHNVVGGVCLDCGKKD